MRLRKQALLATAAAFVIAACSNGTDTELVSEAGNSAPAEPEEGESTPGEDVAVVSAETELGNILVDADGMTLYGFTNDADGQSECYDTCAEAWPPLTVDSDWTVGPELDSGIFNTHTRDDGAEQVVAGPWPLYRFAQDVVPGDIKGQGSGGVWYVVSAEDGTLIRDEPGDTDDGGTDDGDAADATDVQIGSTDLGDVLTDAEGFTLYGLTEDTDGQPTCTGECAGTWPALLVEGDEVSLAEGLDPDTFTTVEGAEGGTQVVAGVWPLYRFAGDGSPGEVNGQGVGGVWFAVAPDGSLIDVDGTDDGMDDMDDAADMDGGMDDDEADDCECETPEPDDGYGDDGYEDEDEDGYGGY